MARADMMEAVRIHEELQRRKAGRKLLTYYPDTGLLRRELYPKHLEFFGLGAHKRERLFLAANRVGKTEGAGGYELTCHLTGKYPAWWTGRRFNRAIQCWAAGDTRETVRDILQLKLLGKRGSEGTGLIPRDSIHKTSPGFIPDSVQAIWVQHESGGISVVQFKSYDQGREAFQGTEQDIIWLDEEPPQDVYTECLLRTMTNNGLVMLTFTPLRGMSEVVLSFMPGGAVPEKQDGPKAVVSATWDDVPHLGEKEKAELLASIPPFQRDARSKGMPQMGAGLIYPVPESVFVVDAFDMPKHWPRSYGLDVGWNMTAAVFGAIDRETDIAYVYSVHRRGEVEPAVHAAAIRARGQLKGAIDPASAGSSQVDGKKVMEEYQKLGLELEPAANAVDAGILATWERLATGRLKVFRSCMELISEMRLYRRNEKGRVVKENDHACFVPGTMVETRGGPRPIEALVGTQGEVMTSGGAWASYRNARRTRERATVVTLSLDDGRSVTCTPDHRFLTPNGWVQASELVGHSVYDAVAQRIQWTRPSFLQPAKSFLAAASTFAASISSATACAFIALFGRQGGERFLTASTSTIGTRTEGTTPWPTWSSSPPQSTSAITPRGNPETFRPEPARPRGFGIQAMRGASGIGGSTPSTAQAFTRSSASYASTAGSTSSPLRMASTASVPAAASPSGASRLASTTRNALASFAARLLWRTATRRNAHARANALRRCVSVASAGSSDVFCLEVPGAHAFAVAGGLVAHNCDAMRYWVMTGIDIARAPSPLKPKPDPLAPEFGGAASWMG